MLHQQRVFFFSTPPTLSLMAMSVGSNAAVFRHKEEWVKYYQMVCLKQPPQTTKSNKLHLQKLQSLFFSIQNKCQEANQLKGSLCKIVNICWLRGLQNMRYLKCYPVYRWSCSQALISFKLRLTGRTISGISSWSGLWLVWSWFSEEEQQHPVLPGKPLLTTSGNSILQLWKCYLLQ